MQQSEEKKFGDFHEGIYAFLNRSSPCIAQTNSAPWPFKDTLKCSILKKDQEKANYIPLKNTI